MAKKAKTGSSSKNVLKVNMTGVSSGGGRVRLPEGDYKVRITKAEKGESKSSGNPQLVVTFQITEGKLKGKEIRDYLTLTKEALWRLGNLLDAAGIKWSAKAIAIPLDKLVGKELGITVYDDEYNNKISSKISDFLDKETIDGLEEADEEEDDDEDDDDEDEDEDDDDDDDDEIEELDVDDEL